jgi:cytochrome b561
VNKNYEKIPAITVGLHWIIAIAMIAMLAFGIYVEDLPRSPEKGDLIAIHKSVGFIILVLALIRIAWRVISKYPEALGQTSKWQEIIAKLTLLVLILGTVMLPVSGIAMSIGGGHGLAVFGIELIARSGEKMETLSRIGHILHGLGGNLVIAFIVLHIAGAIKHEHIDKDGTLSRMLGR